MYKGSITDTRIRVRPTKKLIELIATHKDSLTDIPENVSKVLKTNGYNVPSNVETIKNETRIKTPQINRKLLQELLEQRAAEKTESKNTTKDEQNKNNNDKQQSDDESEPKKIDNNISYLYLNDLKWLNNFFTKLRDEQDIEVYLYQFLPSCGLELPVNDIIERNPVLEARCQKLREEQQNRDYHKMTKNVDAALKNYPEDTIAYQMKSLNAQIIAVLQFVFSVAAGFTFGFLGVQLIVGNLDFGFRLLLGIMCALIIALAEIYFLAKKLNEYDDVLTTTKTSFHSGITSKQQKVHND